MTGGGLVPERRESFQHALSGGEGGVGHHLVHVALQGTDSGRVVKLYLSTLLCLYLCLLLLLRLHIFIRGSGGVAASLFCASTFSGDDRGVWRRWAAICSSWMAT